MDSTKPVAVIRRLLAAVAAAAALSLFGALAQDLGARSPQAPKAVPVSVQPVAFGESIEVSRMPAMGVHAPGDQLTAMSVRSFFNQTSRRQALAVGGSDDARQTVMPQPNMPSPSLVFDGLSSADDFGAFGFRVSPPDTNGDVGPNHFMQATNMLVRVFSKAGATLSTFKMSSLFAPVGGVCATHDDGDPIVLYDPLADRWLLSQFAFIAINATPYHECIAISKTADPTGAYFVYDYVTPGNEFPDYPHFGVWPDAYYMTTNQFLNGGSFDGTGAFAFDRAKMLVGNPTASLVYFNLNPPTYPEFIGGMLPSDFDGLTPPPAGRPNTFAYYTATEFGDPADGLRLFDFDVDFAVPANSTFTERAESSLAVPVAVAAFNPLSPPGRDQILQSGQLSTSNAALDAISDRLMFRLQYRNTGTTESLVVAHTVNAHPTGSLVLGTYYAGVRYYQLSKAVAPGPYAVVEQATYSPDNTSRWMPSAATDYQGNLAVGYSTSSASVFPSLNIAGRLAADPANQLAQGESVFVAGTGIQTSTSSRWGDYSALTVDPVDDCTFWFTSEYYTAASQATASNGWLTSIGNFKFAGCTSVPKGTLSGAVTNANTAAGIVGATVSVSNGFSQLTVAAGAYSRVLAPGTYNVTFSAPGYASVTVNSVSITNGNITTLNQALAPQPIMAPDTTTFLAESYLVNSKIDPGETVRINFRLRNDGPGATSNLVATMLATGGVLNPDAPKTYGVVAAAGNGTQAFTFRADPALVCGTFLIATMQLQDGATNLGNVQFLFPLGAAPLAENFDGVTAPALPAGWTATNPTPGPLPSVLWTTAYQIPDSSPNAAFVDDPSNISDKQLLSPSFAIATAAAQVSFRNNYFLESTYDGGVLEISIAAGAFTDIIAAGGSWVVGGYNGTINATFGNPLAGRNAWTGNSGGYITTTANLPAAAAGQTVQLRFRMGSDNAIDGNGWWIDSIRVTETGNCASPAGSFVQNGTFGAGLTNWTIYATDGTTANNANPAYVVHNSGAGNELKFYRLPTAGPYQNEAEAIQSMSFPVVKSGPLQAQFDVANTSTTLRKRMSVLLYEADFSDLSICTFWLDPNAAGEAAVAITYRMRMHTNKAWTSPQIAFYAHSVNQVGDTSNYKIDNVVLTYQPAQSSLQTECEDPTRPGSGGITSGDLSPGFGPDGPNPVAPWVKFGQVDGAVTGGGTIFEMMKQAVVPPQQFGVLYDQSATYVTDNQRVAAIFELGNTHPTQQQRIKVVLGSKDFADFAACNFYIPANSPPTYYGMRTFSTKTPSGAPDGTLTLSFYPSAPTGVSRQLQVRDVQFGLTTTLTIGSECYEPGAVPSLFGPDFEAHSGGAGGRAASTSLGARAADWSASGFKLDPSASAGDGEWQAVAASSGAAVLQWSRAIDLRSAGNAVLSFSSTLPAGRSSGEVQVSEDGVNWRSLMDVPASDQSAIFDASLAEFAGQVIYVRFVFRGVAPAEGARTDVWRLSDVRVQTSGLRPALRPALRAPSLGELLFGVPRRRW